MSSKERVQRLKREVRTNILNATMNIARGEGWNALSMRKIADRIEYTPPVIYEYFENKNGILLTLTRKGYRMLIKAIASARNKYDSAEDKLEAMWMAYWDFASIYPEYYRLMYGVEIICCIHDSLKPEIEMLKAAFSEVIALTLRHRSSSEKEIAGKYLTYWSLVHGFISISMVHAGNLSTDKRKGQILQDAKVITGATPR